MASCVLNGCEIHVGDTVCPECGARQPGAARAAERAYWNSRNKPSVLVAVNKVLDNLGDKALVDKQLHEEFLDCVDARVA